MDRTVESRQEALDVERGAGAAKDLETGIELGSPRAQLSTVCPCTNHEPTLFIFIFFLHQSGFPVVYVK